MRVVLVDTEISNVASIRWALELANFSVQRVAEPSGLDGNLPIVLPGVGSFAAGMAKLSETGWVERLRQVARETPILGICLGMQLLLTEGEEHGTRTGLGLIRGTVRPLATLARGSLPAKISRFNTGWRSISKGNRFSESSEESSSQNPNPFYYFNHSFYCDVPSEYVEATVDGASAVPAVISYGTVTGFQFHPELSGNPGLTLLRSWGDNLQ